MTIKRLTSRDSKSLREVFEYCFFGDEPEWGDSEWKDYLELINYDSSLGYYVNNRFVSFWVVVDFNIFIRNILFNMGGICGVATLPEYRRQNIVSQLAKESFKIFKEKNQVISTLYPFRYSFYRKFGYELCCQFKWVQTKPGNILLPPTFIPLKIHELSLEDSFHKVKPIREKDGQKYNYILYSSITSWKLHHFTIKKTKIYTIEDSSRTIVGYFITHLTKRNGSVKLHIDDYNIDSEDAFLTILDYIKKHTDQIKDFEMPIHDEERLSDYFEEVDEFSFKYNSVGGAMFRIIDIRKALSLLRYPEELVYTFTMRINDDYAPWNSEPVVVQISKGKAVITKNDDPHTQCDVSLDILAFNQLFVGYRSIYDLINAKKAIIADSSHIDLLDKAFPKRKTYLSTIF